MATYFQRGTVELGDSAVISSYATVRFNNRVSAKTDFGAGAGLQL